MSFRQISISCFNQLRASSTEAWCTGFMPPSLAARYGGPFQNPNPDIRPERSRGYDVGIERFVLSGRGSLGLTWFRTELRDLIGFQSAPFPGLGMSVNVDRARTTGLEAAGRLTGNRTDLRLAWTWLSARSESAPSRDLARLIVDQVEETKKALIRTVTKEFKDFLEATDLATELQKALTSLSLELRTEVRFVANDRAIGGIRPSIEIKAARARK